MWVFPRSTSFPSPPAVLALTSELWRLSADSALILESSLMWRSKPMPVQSWQRIWKRVGWIRALFGRIYEPSTGNLSMELWIWSLRAIRANRFPSPDLDSDPKIRATCGPQSLESSEKQIQDSSSLKMSAAICLLEHTKSPESFKKWAIALRRACLRRRKLGLHTRESGSSSWPTPSGSVINDGESIESWEARQKRNLAKHCNGNEMGTPLPIAAVRWGTPRNSDGMKHPLVEGRSNRGRIEDQVANWQTPSVTDSIGRDYVYPGGDHTKPFATLTGQAVGTKFHSPQGPLISSDGIPTSPNSRFLNPRFVEALMGWPIDWTVCAFSEME